MDSSMILTAILMVIAYAVGFFTACLFCVAKDRKPWPVQGEKYESFKRPK